MKLALNTPKKQWIKSNPKKHHKLDQVVMPSCGAFFSHSGVFSQHIHFHLPNSSNQHLCYETSRKIQETFDNNSYEHTEYTSDFMGPSTKIFYCDSLTTFAHKHLICFHIDTLQIVRICPQHHINNFLWFFSRKKNGHSIGSCDVSQLRNPLVLETTTKDVIVKKISNGVPRNFTKLDCHLRCHWKCERLAKTTYGAKPKMVLRSRDQQSKQSKVESGFYLKCEWKRKVQELSKAK